MNKRETVPVCPCCNAESPAVGLCCPPWDCAARRTSGRVSIAAAGQYLKCADPGRAFRPDKVGRH